MVGASAEVICSKPPVDCMMNGASETDKSRTPLVEYIFSLVEWLRLVVEQGEKDLLEACKNSFVHGVLLSLRYTFEELDWNSEVVSSSISGIRCALQELLELVMRISSLALWVVSADAWYLPNDMDDDNIDDLLLSDVQIEMDVSESSSGFTDKSLELMDSVRPTEQVVMVGCWLAMKEVSLLLGTIIRKIPLPSCTSSNSSDLSDVAVENVELPSLKEFDMVLDFKQLKNIGNHFLQVLLKMKHNGAIDKTRAGFTALCNRLLCSNDSRLCKLTESWMELLMEKMVSQGQTVDDLLRRSAGIPAAFIALFLAEPEGMPKKLLPQALRWLIDVATMSLPHVSKVKNQNGEVTWTTKNQISEKSASNGRASKSRDEGVIPTVHAFNVLRVAFNDTNLATDTSGFSAEALIISIRSFASPYWEVRNSACLAYTALVRRMIGFLNVHKRESARRALTGLEFFYRYPSLHSFLLSELKIATDSLENGCTKSSEFNIVKAIHPSLCPILILLSRLKPSQVSIATNDVLDPLLFMPFTRRCATQNNLRVRVLASRALTGLVSNEKLQAVMRCIAEGLPQGENQVPIPNGICLNSHSPSNMVNGTNIEKSHHVSFNSIHGILLQLSALLDTNCRSLIDVSRKDQILEDLIKILVKCSWIGSIKSCPCPTLNSSYLQVLNHVMDIARTCGVSKHFTHVRSFLMELSLECLDAEVSRRPSLYDPTKAELRRQAAFSYFGCVFEGSAEATDDGLEICKLLPPNSSYTGEDENLIIGLHEKLLVCISDDMHEVRLATLKCLFRLLKFMKCSGHRSPTSESTDNFYMWAKSNLQPTLMERLYVENNPKCIYYILRNIFLWNVLQLQKCSLQNKETISFMGVDRAFVFQFWDRLVSLNKCVPRAKTRESLLCCMGICVRHLAILFRNSASSDDSQIDGECTISSRGTDQSAILTIYECINFFINLVKQHSASSEPVNMRRAAAESLIASGLLEEALWVGPIISEDQNSFGEELISDSMQQITDELEPAKAINFYAQRILDMWVICIRLLEDEDIQLRQNLSKSVQRCIDSKGSTKSNLTESAPAQVEKVIVSSFEFLSSVFGHWTLYIDYLLRWVLDMGHYIRAQGDLVRRVFDKEIDNHHEERLLICQLCCSNLGRLLMSKTCLVSTCNEVNIQSFIQRWRTRFLDQLISYTNGYLEIEGASHWIGGIGNHKDAFIPLYANLLGLHALSQFHYHVSSSSMERGCHTSPLLSDLIRLDTVIGPFLRNPLISNLYFSVIQTFEKLCGVTTATESSKTNCPLWKGFNPYFLLN
ncbi:hypothetical protein QJS10_CPB21g00669 [Acorus calamus]|uniref:Thyroid adenoma-associated protein homolog n=1 Tax=Acorus calamus TaxID=4465 RepID=A0AAV9C6G3_ACOCL|nr:hypothetical protein QJS10_CPB21g00669 [Acorus calamus]